MLENNKVTIKNLFWMVVLAILLNAIVGGLATFAFNKIATKTVVDNGDGGVFGGFADTKRVDLYGSEAKPRPFTTGTSTIAYNIGGETDSLDVNVMLNSENTDSVLYWINYFSNDANCASTTDPTISWFAEDVKSTSGVTTTHGATALVHSWSPGTTGAHYKNIGVVGTNAMCVKTTFYNNSTTDDSTLWVEGLAKANR